MVISFNTCVTTYAVDHIVWFEVHTCVTVPTLSSSQPCLCFNVLDWVIKARVHQCSQQIKKYGCEGKNLSNRFLETILNFQMHNSHYNDDDEKHEAKSEGKLSI